MKEARLVHIMAPTAQFMGWTRQANHEPLITLTDAALVTYQQSPRGPVRHMRSIASDKDYKSGEIIIRSDCVIIAVAENENEGSLYRQYMDTTHPGRVQKVENKIVAPGGAAVN